MRALLALALPILLAGCAVSSQAPLFAARDAAPRPLPEGLWALSGPGCEVGELPAGARLPDCAIGLIFGADRMTVDLDSLPAALKSGPAGLAGSPFDFSKGATKADVAAILLVDGKPLILQVGTGPINGPSPPEKVTYYAIETLQTDAQGRTVKAVMWPIACPAKGQDVTGFKLEGPSCGAETADAVRRQAPRLPPFFSFYLTWVRPQALPPPKPAG